MTTVYWTPVLPQLQDNSSGEWAQILIQEPKPALQYFAQQRENSTYMRCPAFVDYLKNTYVLESPVDITLTLSYDPFSITTENQNQHFFDEFVGFHVSRAAATDPPVLTLPPHILFYSHSSVETFIQSPILTHQPRLNSMRVIPGVFDIGRWMRPVECSFELPHGYTRLEVRAGDPLLLIRFAPADGGIVRLERVEFTDKLRRAVASCVTVKNVRPHMKLRDLYEYAAGFLQKVLR